MLLADVSDGVKGIEGAHDGGPGGGADEEGNLALRLALLDEAVELGWDHAASGGDGECVKGMGCYLYDAHFFILFYFIYICLRGKLCLFI